MGELCKLHCIIITSNMFINLASKKKNGSLSYNLNFYNAAFPGNTQALSTSYSLTNCHWSACTPTLLVCLANGYRYLTHKQEKIFSCHKAVG